MKQLIKNILRLVRPTPIYRWLRYHPLAIELHANIWRDRRALVQREQQLFLQLLDERTTTPRPLIFDIGAHRGDLTAAFLRRAGRVICVEAQPEYQKILHRRFSHRANFQLVRAAISNQSGTVPFFQNRERDARSTLNQKWNLLQADRTDTIDVEARTLRELIRKFGVPHLLKIDVEGAEREVLTTLDQPVPILTFETNLPEFARETRDIFEHLKSIYGHYQVGIIKDNLTWWGNDTELDRFDFSQRRSFDFVIVPVS